MDYILTFIEGIASFISPCLLPMLPIYISYFAGGGERSTKKTLTGAIGFVLGFTVVFIAMGALAGTLGGFLTKYQSIVNLIMGLIIVMFGLNYLGVLKLSLFGGSNRSINTTNMGFGSAMLLGIVFSVGWTPCVGAFLGSALMLATQQGKALIGMGMLLCYSIGLGIPFIISAVLIDKLKFAFDFIKRNYRMINIISGSILVLIGLLMATGMLGKWMSLLS